MLYRFPGFLSIHHHQFECRQKAKSEETHRPQLFHWPDEKGDPCFSQPRKFFRYDFHHNNSTKNTEMKQYAPEVNMLPSFLF